MNLGFYNFEELIIPLTEFDHTVECLTRALALRDLEMEEHACRVITLTLNLAHAAGVPPAELFIPSIALTLGVWGNNSKAFEVFYVTMWYIGPMIYVYAMDNIGTKGHGNIKFFIPFSFALIVGTFAAKRRDPSVVMFPQNHRYVRC